MFHFNVCPSSIESYLINFVQNAQKRAWKWHLDESTENVMFRQQRHLSHLSTLYILAISQSYTYSGLGIKVICCNFCYLTLINK